MSGLQTRRMCPEDRPAIEALLDASVGRGFWDPLHDLDGIVLVASEDGGLVGVASASVDRAAGEDGDRVGHVRLVAVEPAARRRGVATRLVAEISELCAARGVTGLRAYAWVHSRAGSAPLAVALERAGYTFDRRIEAFYGGVVAGRCPACDQSPCVCPADEYRRDLRTGVD